MKFTFPAILFVSLLISCSTYQKQTGRFLASEDFADEESAKTYYPAQLPSLTGEIKDTSRFATVNHPVGFMTYGPYETKLKKGLHKVIFSLSVDNNTANNLIVAEVNVLCNSNQNAIGNLALARQEIRRKDFIRPFAARNFHLVFNNPGCDSVEYRVIHKGTSYLQHHLTWVKKIKSTNLSFSPTGPDGYSSTGRAWGDARYVLYNDAKNYLTYGPYTTLVKKGRNRAVFNLAVDNNTADNKNVATIDVYSRTEQKKLAVKNINRKDFRYAKTVQAFTLDFDNNLDQNSLEFRVYFNGATYLLHLNTEIEYYDSTLLSDLWQRNAQFKFKQEFTFPEVHTSSLVTRNGKWYAFNRNFPNGKLEVVVRESIDKGKTWSEAFVVATPTPGTGYSEHITDGSAYFDVDTGRWHFITQCMGQDKKWKLCHFYRDSESPLGEFTPNAKNPVVEPRQLWSNICGGNNCPRGVYDEGTPEIHFKEDGYFWVSFHGYLRPNGYRGLAKTKDFVKYEIPENGLLSTKKECSGWMSKNDGGCIGVGHTSTFYSQGYFYSFVEAASKSLACTKDQEWVVGLIRRKSFLNKGPWEQYQQNPIINNLTRSIEGCSIQYHKIFYDQGRMYVFFSFRVNSLHYKTVLYELTPGYGDTQIIVGD
jgi:hypothetical protein